MGRMMGKGASKVALVSLPVVKNLSKIKAKSKSKGSKIAVSDLKTRKDAVLMSDEEQDEMFGQGRGLEEWSSTSLASASSEEDEHEDDECGGIDEREGEALMLLGEEGVVAEAEEHSIAHVSPLEEEKSWSTREEGEDLNARAGLELGSAASTHLSSLDVGEAKKGPLYQIGFPSLGVLFQMTGLKTSVYMDYWRGKKEEVAPAAGDAAMQEGAVDADATAAACARGPEDMSVEAPPLSLALPGADGESIAAVTCSSSSSSNSSSSSSSPYTPTSQRVALLREFLSEGNKFLASSPSSSSAGGRGQDKENVVQLEIDICRLKEIFSRKAGATGQLDLEGLRSTLQVRLSYINSLLSSL